MPPELVTVAEAMTKLKVTRGTFYDTVKKHPRVKRWRRAGDRRVLYDLRQLRPLFEPRLLKP